ncbi:membrane protein insertase YidC [Methyloceanibacter sp. wino2]|uniref:membrane protein insertase YidC n=1 Tax=Methyloceanibacter sp. wino2 TaxID=2170729 RepID=UPI000D3EBE8D|nr:membrane protein insertase YidC [Methyloceanibacter sp. wino2]
MDENNRNFILAIVLSMTVLFAWQFFFVPTKPPEEQQAAQTEQTQTAGEATTPTPSGAGQAPRPGAGTAPQPEGSPTGMSRKEALAASPRIAIDTPSVRGSISLKGARIDDLTLKDYRVTVDPDSPQVILLSPAGGPHAYYAERGYVGDSGNKMPLPTGDTLWTAEGDGKLTPDTPITLTYDNGEGLTFTRTISVDDKYMFTIDDKVANTGTEKATIYPYGLVSRHELPDVQGFYILHEGLIGVVDDGLEEISYSSALEDPAATFKSKNGWLGITDKYWATTVIPAQGIPFDATFKGSDKGGRKHFQTDYLMQAMDVPPGATVSLSGQVFAGAKEVNVVDGYAATYDIPKFDLLIDWGWFYFLTRPLFYALDYFYKLVGNFGVSILIVTVLIKLVLFPLANKSYVSMSRMKKLAPEMQKIKERYGDDRMRQQQAMMDLYKKEKVNPASGCLPILVQIPVFFALYKVLFVTIEMRHAPFFGWIKDLSAPDPTTVFNLFGLIPWDPPMFLMVGAWPIIMGITMWFQMKLNPAPPDPIQQKIFGWMPIVFTYMLASFPSGLVIYWAWNNFLSILQQSVIMWRQGVDIPLLENLGLKPKADPVDDTDDAKSAREAAEEKRSAKASRRAERAAKQIEADEEAGDAEDAVNGADAAAPAPKKAAPKKRAPRKRAAKKSASKAADQEADGESPA